MGVRDDRAARDWGFTPAPAGEQKSQISGDGTAEGTWRGPFYGEGELGTWFAIDPLGDWWQQNLSVGRHTARNNATCYASVMAISRAISQCYPLHKKETPTNISSITTSAAYEVLNRPNSYQSGPLFLLNLVARALFVGESFALALRDSNGRITSLHLLNGAYAQPLALEGEIFYGVGGNFDLVAPLPPDFVVPQRDILHLRFYTPRHPLIGESPIKAAALALGINVALSRSQAAFFAQMNRPSGILSTEQTLNIEQMRRARTAFEEQAKAWAQGGMPILSNGMKFQQLSVTSQDAQLVEAQRMSIHEICRVYGVPPPLIGELSEATLNNAETLIQHFLSMSLGSYLEILEGELTRLFGLPLNEYVELDTRALLRTDFERRIKGLAAAVQGGLMTPDEARRNEGLPPVDGGDQAFMQRQMTPINLIAELAASDLEKAKEPPPAPAQPVALPAPAPTPADAKLLIEDRRTAKAKPAVPGADPGDVLADVEWLERVAA